MGIGSNMKQNGYYQEPFLVFWSDFYRISDLDKCDMTDVNSNAIIACAMAKIDISEKNNLLSEKNFEFPKIFSRV